ncbi:MAG: phenylalanine--tRNA ligase subunit beta [Endozoicomonadaceae bacterium]|nr:phenylalanine--tRNA ligase subunit beta [Endozoicomonadaceae bacterium]
MTYDFLLNLTHKTIETSQDTLMKVSEHWLNEWVDLPNDIQETTETLTMLGLEIEAIQRAAPPFTGVIIAEIIACKPVEQSDHLHITTVATSDHNTVQVVCGAPNVHIGAKIPFAQINAKLPGNITIKEVTLRGIISYGMLCSACELGLPKEEDNGLMLLPKDAPVGEDIRHYLNLNDTILDISITPNRADCLSIMGLSRELSLKYPSKTIPINLNTKSSITTKTIKSIHIADPDACPIFMTRIFENLELSQSIPIWMKNRLMRAGIRPTNPVTDITQYVMLELGQPLQAYDATHIPNALHIRYSQTNEKLTLLNQETIHLKPDTLLVCHEESPVGLAGIMGGLNTCVTNKTTCIILESAYYKPTVLAGKARSYGLSTETAHRFERGVDPQLVEKALERASALILQLCQGHCGPINRIETTHAIPKPLPISFRYHKIESTIGTSIPPNKMNTFLTKLGCKSQRIDDHSQSVLPPSWRVDLLTEIDLIEEMIRIQGYQTLPETKKIHYHHTTPLTNTQQSQQSIAHYLISRGYSEAINFSFIDPLWQQQINPDLQPIQLTNPIASDLSVMRTSLIPGLLKTVQYNQKRQQSHLRLFERGQCFFKKSDTIVYENRLSAIIYGSRYPENSANPFHASDFYDLKGDLESLMRLTNSDTLFQFEQGKHAAMHPGQTAQLLKQGNPVGYIGSIHPLVLKKLAIKGPIYTFELNDDALDIEPCNPFKTISKYPTIRRDIALFVNQNITSAQIITHIKQVAGPWLVNIFTFDAYTGNSTAAQQKSLAFALMWQHPNRTLKDDEINEIFNTISSYLKEKLDAILRN